MAKPSNVVRDSRSSTTGRFVVAKKSGSASVVEMKPVTKRGSISQAQAERAVKDYLAETKSK